MRQHEKKKGTKGKIQIESVDIREVLEDLNIHYTETGKNVSSGWIGTSCPWCDDVSNHLGINLESKIVTCFKCGSSGNIINYLAEELNSFAKALDILRSSVPRELKSFTTSEKERSVYVELPKEASTKITPYHAGYIESRNFDYEQLTKMYSLHFVGPVGKWKNKIIVPFIKNYKLITFTSIDISDETEIRYNHLAKEKSIIHVKEWLFGIEHTNKRQVIVTEGFFDMCRFGYGAVCTFGTTVTSEQKKLLSKFDIVKIVFDGDDAGRSGAEKLANDLSLFCDVRIFDIPDGLDPDKLSEKEIKYIKEK